MEIFIFASKFVGQPISEDKSELTHVKFTVFRPWSF